MAFTIPKEQFKKKFTDAEWASFVLARGNDMEVFRFNFLIKDYIDSEAPDVTGGFALMVAKSILTQARADEILAA